MKFKSILIMLFSAYCMISCSNSDEPGNGHGNRNDNNSKVTINADGTTSNGSVFSVIDNTSFYLDYIKYKIVDSHLEIVGHDPVELKGDVRPYATVTYNGSTYNTRAITGAAFSESEITSIIIPNTVTTIEYDYDYPFKNCKNLVSVIFPETMDRIEGFNGCSSLSTIIFPKYLKSIHRGFNDCTKLTSIELPDSLTEIWGFNDCINLVDVKFPKSLTEIDGFSKCSQLTTVEFPESIRYIYGFIDCAKLTSVYFPVRPSLIIWGYGEKQGSYIDLVNMMDNAFLTDIWITNIENVDFYYYDVNDWSNAYKMLTLEGCTLHIRPSDLEYCKAHKYWGTATEIKTDYDSYKSAK